MRTTTWVLAFTVGGLWLFGCGSRVREGGDSNSNWLQACEREAECGSGLECLCGVCSVECTNDGTCSRGEAAVCERPRGCSAPVSVCIPASWTLDVDTAAAGSSGASSEPGGPALSSELPAPSAPPTDTTPVTPMVTTSGDVSIGGGTTHEASLADGACSVGACRAGAQCVEPSGRNCECPTEALSDCEELKFRTLPFPDGLQSCGASAASSDASVVAGDCQIIDGPNRAVQWRASGPQVVTSDLDTLTLSRGVTDDGEAAFWLGENGGTYRVMGGQSALLVDRIIEGASADGLIAAGTAPVGFELADAFRWTAAAGFVRLAGTGGMSQVSAISADGTVIVGSVNYGGTITPAWWDRNDEIHELEVPPEFSSVTATAANENGTVIAGSSDRASVLWTPDGTKTLIELGSSSRVQARAVTRDGKRVLGTSAFGGWIWDEVNGARSLEGELDMADVWTITWIGGVSGDGNTVVGSVQLRGDVSPSRWFAFVGTLP